MSDQDRISLQYQYNIKQASSENREQYQLGDYEWLTNGHLRSGSPICLLRVWLQAELNDTRYCYQLIKTKKKFEEKARHRLYFFIKYQQLTRRNARQQRALMTRSVYLHRHDVLTFLLIVLLHCPITSVARTLSY